MKYSDHIPLEDFKKFGVQVIGEHNDVWSIDKALLPFGLELEVFANDWKSSHIEILGVRVKRIDSEHQ